MTTTYWAPWLRWATTQHAATTASAATAPNTTAQGPIRAEGLPPFGQSFPRIAGYLESVPLEKFSLDGVWPLIDVQPQLYGQLVQWRPDLAANEDLAIRFAQNYPFHSTQLAPQLFSNTHFVARLVREAPTAVSFVGAMAFVNPEASLAVLAEMPLMAYLIPPHFLHSAEFVRKALRAGVSPSSLQCQLIRSPTFMASVVQEMPELLGWAPVATKEDVALQARAREQLVQGRGPKVPFLSLLPSSLQDKDVVLARLEQCPSEAFFVPPALLAVRAVRKKVEEALSTGKLVWSEGASLKNLPLNLRDNPRIQEHVAATLGLSGLAEKQRSKPALVAKAMATFPHEYAALSLKLKVNIEVATAYLEAVGEQVNQSFLTGQPPPPALSTMPEAVRDHTSLAKIAVLTDARNFGLLSARLRNDPEIALIAVTLDGEQLKNAGPVPQGDRTIVLEAVRNAGSALAYSPAFQSDYVVVEEAVRNDANALQFARLTKEELKRLPRRGPAPTALDPLPQIWPTHPGAARKLMTERPELYPFLTPALRAHPEVAREAVSRSAKMVGVLPPQLLDQREFMKDVATANPLVLDELEPRRASFLRKHAPEVGLVRAALDRETSQLGIRNLSRFLGRIDVLTEIIHNRRHLDEADPRPLQVVIAAEEDWAATLRFLPLHELVKTHRVVYYEENTDDGVLASAREATQLRRAALIDLSAHGDRLRLAYGSDDPAKGGPAVDSAELDFSDAELITELGKCVKEGGHVLLNSCSNGQGFHLRPNITHFISEHIPHAHVYGASGPVGAARIDVVEGGSDDELVIEWDPVVWRGARTYHVGPAQ